MECMCGVRSILGSGSAGSAGSAGSSGSSGMSFVNSHLAMTYH